MSLSQFRAVLVLPLYVSNPNASGDVAYFMADGAAYWEHLQAACDSYHMNRVKRVLILDVKDLDGYNFTKQRRQTRIERTIDFLALNGIPRDAIDPIDKVEPAYFGSLSEATGVAQATHEVESIVVVTSSPHTRGSLPCFRRVMPDETRVQVYAASGPSKSAEIHAPI